MVITNLKLHDGTLTKIDVVWLEKKVIFFTSNFLATHDRIVKIELEFNGVKNLHIPMEELWGPSVSINSFSVNNFIYELQMQSGDVIRITASSFCYRII